VKHSHERLKELVIAFYFLGAFFGAVFAATPTARMVVLAISGIIVCIGYWRIMRLNEREAKSTIQ